MFCGRWRKFDLEFFKIVILKILVTGLTTRRTRPVNRQSVRFLTEKPTRLFFTLLRAVEESNPRQLVWSELLYHLTNHPVKEI